MRRFDGAAVLVTGGSSGIGLATAQAFLEEGARVAITGRDEKRLRKARADLSALGKAVAIRGDVSKPVDAKRFVAFGDGRVEVESTKRVGGLAVGVASNEVKRRGVNDRKREHLIQAGADIIVPDFDEHKELIAFLFGL